jgi:hypothetical protein
VHSSYCRNLQIFPEVDFDYRHVNVEKFTGRALFSEKHTSNLETSREVNFWIFFQNSILTIIKPSKQHDDDDEGKEGWLYGTAGGSDVRS